MSVSQIVWLFVRGLFGGRAALAAENLALRQQLVVLRRSVKRPKPRKRDRIFRVWLSRLWAGWQSALTFVPPETVVKWHRQGFKLYWRWKSRKKAGRPQVDRELPNSGAARTIPAGRSTIGQNNFVGKKTDTEWRRKIPLELRTKTILPSQDTVGQAEHTARHCPVSP